MGKPQRLLLFVEPYIVRSGVNDFRTPFEIFRDIASMLAVANTPTAIICNSTFAPDVPKMVKSYTPASFGIDEAMSSDWERNWTKMLAGEDVDRFGAFYRHAIADFQPTLIYIWNKNNLFQSACDAANIKHLTFEYGGVRTASGFRISVDPNGFGPDSALATLPSGDDIISSMSGWEWAATHVYRDALLNRAPHVQLSRTDAKLRICLLLQKEDDVNFLVWPSFSSMQSFIDEVLSRLTKLPDVEITVRPHPAGLHDYSRHIATNYPTVLFDNGSYDFSQLVLGFDAAITLNSAGGFEALCCNLPVLALSKGFYNQVLPSLCIEEFESAVRTRSFWTEQRRRQVGNFIHRLVHHYSVRIELLRLPLFHELLQNAIDAPSSQADLPKWFETHPPNLADIVADCTREAEDLEVSKLRAENFLRAKTIHHLAIQFQQYYDHAQKIFAAMTEANTHRDAAIAQLQADLQGILPKLADMTTQNDSRDQAINQLSQTIADMTRHNQSRDQAIAHINQVLAEMSSQNATRDATLQKLSHPLRRFLPI